MCLEKKEEKKAEVYTVVRRYEMNRKSLGKAVIFYNVDYGNHKAVGNEKDAEDMKRVLEAIEFNVDLKKDLTQNEANTALKEYAAADYTDYNCFLIVFTSHGCEDEILLKGGDWLQIKRDITGRFRGDKCKSLVGKPKIFIFDACRGGGYEEAAFLNNQPNAGSKTGNVNQPIHIVSPAGADYLICYSSATDKLSFGDEVKGSWFLQTLVKILWNQMTDPEAEELDFLTLLTLVADNVANKNHQKIGADENEIGPICLQMPSIVSTLRARLFFPQLRPKSLKGAQPESDAKEEETN